jgi:hypothetical protein
MRDKAEWVLSGACFALGLILLYWYYEDARFVDDVMSTIHNLPTTKGDE